MTIAPKPSIRLGDVEMVSVAWIMQNLSDSIDGFCGPAGEFDWVGMISHKAADRDFMPLVGTIITHGFRVPIVIIPLDERSFKMGNGHHRLAAAILLGLDEIPVYWPRDCDGYMCLAKSGTGSLDYSLWDDVRDDAFANSLFDADAL